MLDKMTPPQMRVITSIKSDTELTVDADFTLSNTTVASTLAHSGTTLALKDDWTYVACPPRIGKRGTGMGVIETHHDQAGRLLHSNALEWQMELALEWQMELALEWQMELALEWQMELAAVRFAVFCRFDVGPVLVLNDPRAR